MDRDTPVPDGSEALVGLTDSERTVLRRLAVFPLPLPRSVVALVAADAGLNPAESVLDQLLTDGRLETRPDPVRPDQEGLVVAPPLQPYFDGVSEEQAANLSRLVVEPLYRAWGSDALDPASRPVGASQLLADLAVRADHAGIAGRTGGFAVYGALEDDRDADRAAALGRACLALVENAGGAPDDVLLRWAGKAALAVGDSDFAERCLTPALSGGNLREDAHLSLRGELANFLSAQGNLHLAETIVQENLTAYQQLGDARSVAVTRGALADILQARGCLDDALRIRVEAELPVYRYLAEPRAEALTQVKIATIRAAQGHVEQAIALLRDQVRVYQQLGDIREAANCLGKIGYILQERERLNDALQAYRQQLQIFEQLDDARERAIAQINVAILLLRIDETAHREDARSMLEAAEASCTAMELPERAQAAETLAYIRAGDPPPTGTAADGERSGGRRGRGRGRRLEIGLWLFVLSGVAAGLLLGW